MTFAFAQTTVAAFQPAPSAESSTDESLIERIARRDQLAMRALFARHRLRVYRFALRLVRDETLAEDVLSDVFLDVCAVCSRRAAVSTWFSRSRGLRFMTRRSWMSSRPKWIHHPRPGGRSGLACSSRTGCFVCLVSCRGALDHRPVVHDKSSRRLQHRRHSGTAGRRAANEAVAQLVQDAAPATIH